MRYLKAVEIALAAIWPRGHRLVRMNYDRIGPQVTKLLVHPLAADVAYLFMKPAELTIRAFFVLALPEASRMIKKLYRN